MIIQTRLCFMFMLLSVRSGTSITTFVNVIVSLGKQAQCLLV